MPVPDHQGHTCLEDNYGRRITYLRVSITDRCNLRCYYCRPEEGIPFIPHEEILTLEELERLVALFCSMGVTKVRVTGGEPFSRRGCVDFLSRLRKVQGLKELYLTTNGVKTARFLKELKSIPIDGLNVSLDSLDPERFAMITRRDYLTSVLETLHGTLAVRLPLKVNSVVLADTTDREMQELGELARNHELSVRFIETMPFSGQVRTVSIENGDLVSRLEVIFPGMVEETSDTPTTARLYSVPGFQGRIGVIQGHSRKFCTTCNKVRITPMGVLKTCLYDNGVLDLKAMVRDGASDDEIRQSIVACLGQRFKGGHEAEQSCAGSRTEPCMGAIGG